jgi:hypothetical protein
MLTASDLQNAIVFLRRTTLKGEESMVHAELMIKLGQMLQETQNPAEPPPADPPDEGDKQGKAKN